MEELLDILKTMDIPEMRMDVAKVHNVRWLGRNIMINNREHPKIKRACELIKILLRNAR